MQPFNELYEKNWQNGPMFIKTKYGKWLILPADENEAYFEPVCEDKSDKRKAGWHLAFRRNAMVELIHQFDNGATNAKHMCTCDFYSVVLRSGCQCGGI